MAEKSCKDCVAEGVTTKRPATRPGPRCVTHYRTFKKQQKINNHDRMVSRTYGLETGEYARLYNQQGGVCYICRRANGRTKRLAVDHNHSTGKVRGLLCSPCNVYLGYVREDISAYQRGIEYLENN